MCKIENYVDGKWSKCAFASVGSRRISTASEPATLSGVCAKSNSWNNGNARHWASVNLEDPVRREISIDFSMRICCLCCTLARLAFLRLTCSVSCLTCRCCNKFFLLCVSQIFLFCDCLRLVIFLFSLSFLSFLYVLLRVLLLFLYLKFLLGLKGLGL